MGGEFSTAVFGDFSSAIDTISDGFEYIGPDSFYDFYLYVTPDSECPHGKTVTVSVRTADNPGMENAKSASCTTRCIPEFPDGRGFLAIGFILSMIGITNKRRKKRAHDIISISKYRNTA